MLRNKIIFLNKKQPYCTTNTKSSISVIIDKKRSMDQIRLAIANSIIPIDQTNKLRHFVSVTHTYPAWKKIFAVSNNLKSFMSAVKKEIHTAQNPYGHTLADFFCVDIDTNSIKSDLVMNVGTLGPNGINRNDFIHFFPSEQYYFNNQVENLSVTGNQQGGILERSYVSLVYETDEYTWNKLQLSYKTIKENSKNNLHEFSMCIQMFSNPIKRLANNLAQQMEKSNILYEGIPFLFGLELRIYQMLLKIAYIPEKGNCCYWTSKGFNENCMIDSISNFPMVFFYKMLINIIFRKAEYFTRSTKANDYSIVFYEGLKHKEFSNGSYIHPLIWFQNNFNTIWKPEKIANIHVKPVHYSDSMYKIEFDQVPKNHINNVVTTTITYAKKILKIQ